MAKYIPHELESDVLWRLIDFYIDIVSLIADEPIPLDSDIGRYESDVLIWSAGVMHTC